MPIGPVFECHLNTGQQDHLNTGQMDATMFSFLLVRYSNGRSSTRTVSDHLNTKPFEFQTSNVSGIQVVCIQIPTVFQTADVHGTLENKTAVLNVPRQSKRKLWC